MALWKKKARKRKAPPSTANPSSPSPQKQRKLFSPEVKLLAVKALEAGLKVYDGMKAVAGLGDPIQAKTQEKGVKGLLQHVFGGTPKAGMYQRRVLNSAVDVVGRATIAPNPELGMDQVGLPEPKAWTIYRPFVVRNLVRRGLPASQAAIEVANQSNVARDALQEIFRQSLQYRSSFKRRSQPLNWLHRITTNYCYKQWNQRKNQLHQIPTDEPAEAESNGNPSRIEQREFIAKIMNEFGPKTKQVVMCTYFEGLRQEEVALVMGISDRAVRQRLTNFKAKARQIAAQWFDQEN